MDITIVSSASIVNNNWILKPNYHMNFGKKRIEKAIIKKQKFDSLGNVTSNIFTGGIFKRFFVEKEEFGFPYISAQHMMNSNPLDVAKCISKKYTPKLEEMTLKENQILVSCAGTIGNVKLITSDLTNVVGSQDIIRVNADDTILPYGYIYAYLSTKTAYSFIQSFIYGSVVPRIDPNTLAKLPVPLIEINKIQDIHNLIVEASKLRVEANLLLENSVKIFENKLPLIENRKIYSVSIKDRIKYNSRLESTFDTKQIDKFYSQLKQNSIEVVSIESLSKKVFTPNIFKRIRTDNPDKGIPYLSGSDLLDQYPKFNSFLSKKMTNIDNYILKKDWLAIQDAGTIGYISYIHEFLDGISATNNLIRIVPNEDNWNPYIYTFLKTKLGQRFLKFYEFGSVQKHIDNHQISSFMIPIYYEIKDLIKDYTEKAMDNYALACKKENQAIDLIEKEIDAWQ